MCIHTSSATAEIVRVGDRHAAFIQGRWWMDGCTSRKPICDFLLGLVNNIDLLSILQLFQAIADYW